MNLLADLKAKASAGVLAAEVDVKNYVTELEAAVKAKPTTYAIVGAVCLIVGGVIGHLVK